MKLQRTFICIAGVFFAVGFAASQATAGTGTQGCNFPPSPATEIEVNALRAGGKTIVTSPNDTTKVTAKARILKGTAPSGTTIVTTLTIDAITQFLECIPREPFCELDPNFCFENGDPTCICHPLTDDPDPLCQNHSEELVEAVIGSGIQENITLGVGKGGKGATLVIPTAECGDSGFIEFFAEFRGSDPEGESCIGIRDIRKECR